MTEDIQVNPLPDDGGIRYMITPRPFTNPPPEPEIIETLGSPEAARYRLGFTEQELDDLHAHEAKVLEIGPGQGVSFYQLRHRPSGAIDLYAVEPAKKDARNAAKLAAQYGEHDFATRVSGANAGDCALAFPGIRFAVAFAIGPNFHTYCESEAALISQIGGVMESLDDTANSFLTFEINADGSTRFDFWSGFQDRQPSTFMLVDFLKAKGIRYEVRKFFDYDGIGNDGIGTAIRIFRKNADGEDAITAFDGATQDELLQYTVR